jgi:hypothetical protein
MTSVLLDTVGLVAVWAISGTLPPMVPISGLFPGDLLECGNTSARRTFRADVCALRQTLELRQELIVPTARTATDSVAAMARLRSKRSSEHLKSFFGTSMVSPQSPNSMATSSD